MREPSLEGLLGRYEYKDDKSDKFWRIEFNSSTGNYDVSWGKNGYPPPPKNNIAYTGAQAIKKVQEKIAKGYRLMDKKGLTKLEPPKLPRRPGKKEEDFMTLFKKEIPDEN